ncbi:Uncharacterized protein ChrSV_2354 [Chromobacterium vaccinii]|nr:Uncharacterized protein ChrSW_2354 [Chromobacterium vaccinii]QND89811.1 Uncharacterized protein ChrSV_2354 [Chromobacterium vaccinii]
MQSNCNTAHAPCVHAANCHHHRTGFDARGPVVAEVALRRYQDGSLEFVRSGDVSSLDLTQARFAA